MIFVFSVPITQVLRDAQPATRATDVVTGSSLLGGVVSRDLRSYRILNISQSTLELLSLPARIGPLVTCFVRTCRNVSLFDQIARLRSENKELMERLCDPMRQPPQHQFEIFVTNGEITNDNPLDRNALLRVAIAIEELGILSISAATEMYMDTYFGLFEEVKKHLYPSLNPRAKNRYFEQLIEHRLCANLSIARVPNRTFFHSQTLGCRGKHIWHYSFVPDAQAIEDDDFIATFGTYLNTIFEKQKLDDMAASRGEALNAADFGNLRASVGSRMGELLEYLICKTADDATRRHLGIDDNRTKSSVARYDIVCSQLKVLRIAAEESISARGVAPHQEKKAIQYFMLRNATDLGLYVNQTKAAIASVKARVRHDPNIILTLQAIVRNMGASFKSLDGMTPADSAVLPPDVDKLWGTTGSQTARIHRVLQGWLESTHRTCSITETRSLMQKANIVCAKYRNYFDPISLSQHWASHQMKLIRKIVVAFSAWSFSEGLDYKALTSVQSDKNNRGRGEFMLRTALRETFSHGAGGDNLGKLALFSMLLRPVHESDLVMLFEADGDIRASEIPGWTPSCFQAHPGLAVAVGHVYGGIRGFKESAASNMAHFWQKNDLSADVLQSSRPASAYYEDPAGNPKPIGIHEMDNSHGSADLAHCFMLGIDFLLNDRDINCGISLAGKYSRFMPHECVNGALSTRTNGAPIPVPLASPETARPEELADALEICCDKLISVANGATLKMGGGHVTVVRSALGQLAGFVVRPAEIKRFVEATVLEKAAFVCDPMPSYDSEDRTVIGLYRLVWECMSNHDPETRVYVRGPHLVQWVKRALEVNTFLKPHRAPAAVHHLLEKWGGFFPVVCPSEYPEKQPNDDLDTSGSYMNLGECIEKAATLKPLVGQPGLHYPPALLDELWKKPELRIADLWTQTKMLPEIYWHNMRRMLRHNRASITAEIERRVAMSRRKVANIDLEKAQATAGIQQAVLSYLRSTIGGGDTRVPAMKNILHDKLGMPKRDVPKHRAQCINEIFKRAKLSAIIPASIPAAVTVEENEMSSLETSRNESFLAADRIASEALRDEDVAEEALEEQERALFAESDSFTKRDRLDFDDQDGSSDNDFNDEEDAQPQPTLDSDELQLSTVEDAETLLDALAEHVTRPVSIWGCCSGVEEGRHYFCDSCRLYYHHICQPNESKGRTAPLCGSCFKKITEEGAFRNTRRKTAATPHGDSD